jgi:cell fate (sporulation/competence/biofilm development) regulator YlbF (YheA/YmcA/DUF963 family)
LEFPIVQKYLYFVECDRARGLAKINLEQAKQALEKAKQSLEKIASDSDLKAILNSKPSKNEIDYYSVAAKTAITRAIDGNSSELPSLEAEKAELLSRIEESKAGKLKIRELNYLP